MCNEASIMNTDATGIPGQPVLQPLVFVLSAAVAPPLPNTVDASCFETEVHPEGSPKRPFEFKA
jgi:hypothetical protein